MLPGIAHTRAFTQGNTEVQQLGTSGRWLKHKDKINGFLLLDGLDRQLSVLTGGCPLMLPQTAAVQFSKLGFPSLLSGENETSWKPYSSVPGFTYTVPMT